jgi:iron complex outermembrane recepter protein
MNMSGRRTALGTACAVAMGLVAVNNAAAQGARGIDEIIVTARKREESLQDVPLAITAFSAEDFERRRIDDLDGIAAFTAGMNFESFASVANPFVTLRGLTQADIQNRVQNVAFFLDGAYIPRNYAVNPGLMDLARVEVVKGPQSALYGQNAFAGAVNYVTVKPSLDEIGGTVSGTVGSAGRLDYSASLSVPLVSDMLAVRASYASTEYDGTRRNSFQTVNSAYRELGGYDNQSYNITALFEPTDQLRAQFMFMRSETEREPAPSYTASGNTPQILQNCGPLNPLNGRPSFWCGKLPTSIEPFNSPTSTRPAGIQIPIQPNTKTDADFLRGSLSYDFSEAFSVDYIYGQVDSEQVSIVALPDNPNAGAFTYQKQAGVNDFRSHEVRFIWAPEGPYSFEAGYYGAKQTDDFVFGLALAFGNPSLVITDPTPGGVLDPFPIPLRNFTLRESIDAVFARGSLMLPNERSQITLEGRQTRTRILYTDNVAQRGDQQSSTSSFTPRLTFEHNLADDILLFTSMARGAKAGGFNGFVAGPITLVPDEQVFDEEKNWTYEAGMKSSFLDGRLTLNAVAYYIDWTNMQITSVPTGFEPGNAAPGSLAPTVFLNVGDVRNTGVEFEGQFRATDNISLNYALSFSDPVFRNGTKWGQFVGLCDDVFCPADAEVGGKSLPRQSRNQFALGAQYEGQISASMDYFVRTDVTYTSRQYADALNLAYAPGRYNVNASVGVAGLRWAVTGWVENLLDDTYVTNSLYVVQFRRYSPAINEGIRGGVTATLRF